MGFHRRDMNHARESPSPSPPAQRNGSRSCIVSQAMSDLQRRNTSVSHTGQDMSVPVLVRPGGCGAWLWWQRQAQALLIYSTTPVAAPVPKDSLRSESYFSQRWHHSTALLARVIRLRPERTPPVMTRRFAMKLIYDLKILSSRTQHVT